MNFIVGSLLYHATKKFHFGFLYKLYKIENYDKYINKDCQDYINIDR